MVPENLSNASTVAELRLSVGQHSCAGCKPLNQDSMAARIPDGIEVKLKGAAFAVADGISSSQVSQIASETAVKSLVNDYYATSQAWSAKTAIARVMQATNSWLFAQNRHQRTSDLNLGLVCTLSVLILKARQAHVFHVGDSRVSRLVANVLEPLTQDHVTRVSESESYLGRALGVQPRVEIDYQSVSMQSGDVFVLTTDGVHEFIDAQVIHEAIATSHSLEEAARQVTTVAEERGSKDNLTVQIVRVESLPDDSYPALLDQPLPLVSPLSAGKDLDGYHLIREVHHSSRSQLMLAEDRSGNYIAIKVPGVESGEDPDFLQRFQFEEWVARRVQSPHLVKAAPSNGPRTANYVAMEWIDGCTLRQWMIDNPNPRMDEVRSIAEQVGRGLRALHRQEMIHQDLRPENIMLDRQGTAVIIDLGSVAVAGLEQAVPGWLGPMPGTFQYTAPEYLAGDRVSWRSDQYSLAAIIYEMLTGHLPYGAQVARVRSRRDQQRLSYRKADQGDSTVPEWVDFALARACHPDPTRRYDALSELFMDLRQPSNRFKPNAAKPLLERNPLKFWQGLAVVQLIICILLISL